MKKIVKIARTELQTLFYSPVAWLILVIFTFQVSTIFTDSLKENAMRVSLDYTIFNLSEYAFSLKSMQGYLYLYLPLLTMGLMSRELSTGSIKLLYSSPVSNTQIILGKYLAMVVYGFFLISILLTFLLLGIFALPGLDIPIVLSGIFGIYLLICAYAAIGLFMSSLTSYQVVAAMGTLALFAGLNFMDKIGQDIPFLRDITYWLSLSGRTNFLLSGLICSEDLLYFLIVIAMFLVITILKLQSGRQKRSGLTMTGIYGGVIIVAMLLGYTTSRPMLMTYYDVSRTKINTLTPGSQEIMRKLKGGLTITTYVNIFDANFTEAVPTAINRDMERFRHYVRFKPEIKMKYVYYYDKSDNPLPPDNKLNKLSEHDRAKKVCETMGIDFDEVLSPEALKKQIDLKQEHYRFVRLLERASGERTFLRIFNDMQRHPSEREITAAFKRLAMKLPKVGFVQGDGERDMDNAGDRGYYDLCGNVTSRAALINQGFEKAPVSLSGGGDVAADISILVIADMNKPLTAEEQAKVDRYVARGGNLVIAGDVGRQALMNPLVAPFGVQFMPGQLVQHNKNDLPTILAAKTTRFTNDLSKYFDDFRLYKTSLSMPGTTGLSYVTGKGYDVLPVFVSDSSGSWNELETRNYLDSTPVLNTAIGEVATSYPTVLALSRKLGNKQQKIMILGDADCISNSELSRGRKDFRAANFILVNGMFHWLSDGEVPIDVSRPKMIDDQMKIGLHGVSIAKVVYMGIFPGLLAITGIIIWIRRKRR